VKPYAAVLTHIPDTGETFYTPFDGPDPCKLAERFKESEEERGDFPGSLWTIVANEAAKAIRTERRIGEWVGPDMAREIVEKHGV
jgi:hypothetical protein